MRVLDELAAGVARCVFSRDPETTVQGLLAWGATRPDGERLAVCEVDLGRPVYETVDTLVRSLAAAALVVWPDWYGSPDLFARCDEVALQPTLDRLASAHATARQRSVLRSWLLRAASMCRANTPPVVPDCPPAVQLQQLSLAIASDTLTIVVWVLPADEPEATALLGLARALEWLSRHGGARVVAVLPASWSGRAELDGISWECRAGDEADPVRPTDDPSLDEPLAVVSPIRGRPHPNSPGEQLMAARLGRDPVLGPLFECNMPVTAVRGTRYQVDLVWFGGKVAVEIDGYRCHSSRSSFAGDRKRDYELQLSGYLVLRLTHDSVMADVELAVDKVRDLVRLRLGTPFPSGPSV